MSKSLDFCREIASDSTRSSFTDRDWSNVKEIDPTPIFDNILHGIRKYRLDMLDDQFKSFHLNIDIDFNPNANFTFFTSNTSIHDGTLLFVHECIEKCVMNVITGKTYDSRYTQPKSGDTLQYTVGNIIILSEYDTDGANFAPEDKRWLHERTTALLPISMKVKG